jgi:hypothetical protein
MIDLKKLGLTAFLFVPSLSFAFFCPTNFQQIQFGDNIDSVTKTCGKPDSQDEKKSENENVPQEWTYFVSQTVATASMAPAQGSLKTTIVFDDKGKAINISVNGIGVGASEICGSSIQLGDSRDAIKSACGNPSFINKQTIPTDGSAAPQEKKITTFVYNATNPPTKLIFEDGILKDKQ